MSVIKKIQAQYRAERKELLKKYKSGEIKKADYEDHLQQLERAEMLDCGEALAQGEC
tara:strand:+ start:17 stop:187 length:171 start_codon:yes stop_codon:yes gene_type:complete